MASVKNSALSGRTQIEGRAPNSAASKKTVATTKKSKTARMALATGERGGLSKPGKKSSNASPAYSSLRSRQMLLEKVKRQIWCSVADINQALITAAKAGDLPAAKALFDLAGVYSLPETGSEAKAVILRMEPGSELATLQEQESESEPATVQGQEPGIGEDVDPVDAFFCSIGMAPSAEEDPPAESELEVRMG